MATFTLSGYYGYSDAKISEDKQVELAKIIAKHLKKEDQEGLMRTIADQYIDEGIQKKEWSKACRLAKLREL